MYGHCVKFSKYEGNNMSCEFYRLFYKNCILTDFFYSKYDTLRHISHMWDYVQIFQKIPGTFPFSSLPFFG